MAMKACVFTLGCKLNEVESASLMSGLKALGYETTEELGPADLYLQHLRGDAGGGKEEPSGGRPDAQI